MSDPSDTRILVHGVAIGAGLVGVGGGLLKGHFLVSSASFFLLSYLFYTYPGGE